MGSEKPHKKWSQKAPKLQLLLDDDEKQVHRARSHCVYGNMNLSTAGSTTIATEDDEQIQHFPIIYNSHISQETNFNML